MNGVLLAVDPGITTGYALVEINSRRVIEAGTLSRREPWFRERMMSLMRRASHAVIEGQFIRLGRRANHKTVRSVIEAKGELETLWGLVHGPENRPLVLQPQQWQRPLGIRGSDTKSPSMKVASMSTGREITNHNLADAVNLGLHAVGEVIKQEALLNAVSKGA